MLVTDHHEYIAQGEEQVCNGKYSDRCTDGEGESRCSQSRHKQHQCEEEE